MRFSASKWNPIVFWLMLLWVLCSPLLAENTASFSEGLLFRIEGQGVRPSHIFGTMHSDDKRVVALPTPVRQAFEAADPVIMELELNDATILASMTSMILADGRELRSIIGNELYKRTAQAMAELGAPEIAIRNYKPWAVAIMLSMPPPKSGQFLDLTLYQTARQQGKQVLGLETIDEQLGIFETLSEADQIALLRETLDNRHLFPELFQELTAAYLQRNLEGLMRLNADFALGGDTGLAQHLNERMVDNRNQTMVDRLLPLLAKGNSFIAIGALHLPGEKGILSLLKGHGFRIQPVY